MSRTRHHNSSQNEHAKASSKQRKLEALNIDDLYIELPLTKHLSRKLSRRK